MKFKAEEVTEWEERVGLEPSWMAMDLIKIQIDHPMPVRPLSRMTRAILWLRSFATSHRKIELHIERRRYRDGLGMLRCAGGCLTAIRVSPDGKHTVVGTQCPDMLLLYDWMQWRNPYCRPQLPEARVVSRYPDRT